MTIKEITQDVATSSHPVARALHKSDHFKVLVIGFKKGMILKEHRAHQPSKLTILEGSLTYKEDGRVIQLSKFDELEIPLEVKHSLEASEDSLCLLTQG